MTSKGQAFSFRTVIKRSITKTIPDPIDKLIEFIAILGLILLIVLPVYYYNVLPVTIPRHYGANGQPDGYSGKDIIWTLPIIGIILYVGLTWLNKYPHIFNYPQKVTLENAERLYSAATRMTLSLKALLICTFAYISYSTIQTALGNQFGLGTWFLPGFVVLIIGVTAYSLFKTTK